MLTFDNVSKRYPTGYEALKQVSFHLDPGEMAFLTGHSGAGKSTLLKLIPVIEQATSGQVLFKGINLNRISRQRISYIRRRIGVVFQDNQLLFDRTVFDNVALPLVILGMRHTDIKRRVRAALDKVGLSGKENRQPITLSTGEQQRVGIARAVVNRPEILLADEPTGNLDPELAVEIMQLFELFHQLGVTVLIVSHDLALIRMLNKRTLRLNEGQLVQTV
ncbi:MAG: cell division ATP-binding protein FtsE [Gammaproteobacteria bacterium]|nr:MAG: cell division ATP-binding protein FtsE [Gammaproteobacteria bacterium]